MTCVAGLTEPAPTRNFVITRPTQISELKAPSCSATTPRAHCHEENRHPREGAAPLCPYAEICPFTAKRGQRNMRSGVGCWARGPGDESGATDKIGATVYRRLRHEREAPTTRAHCHEGNRYPRADTAVRPYAEICPFTAKLDQRNARSGVECGMGVPQGVPKSTKRFKKTKRPPA